MNRGRRRGRAWTNRALSAAGAVLVAFYVVYPTLLAVDYLAKPRTAINEAALGLSHERVTFAASDGVRLSGWYIASRNGAAIVLVHGGGGDRQGTIRHARMLAEAGYGVLLYDARGRGESAGHENAFGWRWDRDVRGAVSYLEARGIHRVGLLGLSTGAEAVVTEAATDPRVGAVVADGLQGRTAADASHLGFGNRISLEPAFAVAGAEIRLARGERTAAAAVWPRARARAHPTTASDRNCVVRARVRPGLHSRHTRAALGAATDRAHAGVARPSRRLPRTRARPLPPRSRITTREPSANVG